MSFNVATVGTVKTAFFDGESIQYARTAVAANDAEAMTLKVASIVEVNSAGDAVGALTANFVDNYDAVGNFDDGFTYPQHTVSFDGLTFDVSASETVKYQGIAAKHVTYTASLLNDTASLRLESYIFQDSGMLTNYDEQVPVTNGTMKVNVEVDNWPFCTEDGSGFNRCMKVPDDIYLEDVKVPHTLLIPKCEGDDVATLEFHCVGDDRCGSVKKVWFFFGASPDYMPVFNKLDIGQPSEDNIYRYTFNNEYLYNLVGIKQLTPGETYNFYTVYGFDATAVAPQLDTKEYDMGREQVWQCPNTIIPYNYQVGAYLDVTLSVMGGDTPALMDCVKSGSVRRRLMDTPACDQGSVYSLGKRARLTLSSNVMVDKVNKKLKAGYPTFKNGEVGLRFGKFEGSLVYDPVMDYDMSSSDDAGMSKGGSIAVGICVAAAVVVAAVAGALMWRRRKGKKAALAAASVAKVAPAKPSTTTNSPMHT